MTLTKQQHKERHEVLHKMLDELVADFIDHTQGSLNGTSIMQLIEWSYQQTKQPDEKHA